MSEFPAAAYGDTEAMNDIHAILTLPGTLTPAEQLQAIADFTTRTGRIPHPARHLTATIEEGAHGMPVARFDAEGTEVFITQCPDSPGIRIDISPRDPADEAALIVTVAGRTIRRARPAGVRPVASRPAGQR